jgi:hypothetical protein
VPFRVQVKEVKDVITSEGRPPVKAQKFKACDGIPIFGFDLTVPITILSVRLGLLSIGDILVTPSASDAKSFSNIQCMALSGSLDCMSRHFVFRCRRFRLATFLIQMSNFKSCSNCRHYRDTCSNLTQLLHSSGAVASSPACAHCATGRNCRGYRLILARRR